jgi:XRE family transcriptional regulator of biofilm formation
MGESTVGERIRQRRNELGLTLSALAEKAGVAKSYLSNLENSKHEVRPSGRTLYQIADALGTTMSDLMGTRILVEPTKSRPASLLAFAETAQLTDRDVEMLACINFRGQQPSDEESWAFVWRAIRMSVDENGQPNQNRSVDQKKTG